jgi:two-component system, chemotaxis family, sensor kinase CheA
MAEAKSRSRSWVEQIVLSTVLGLLSLGACVFIIVSYYSSVSTHIERIAESALGGASGEVTGWVRAKRSVIQLADQALSHLRGDREEVSRLLASINSDDSDFVDVFYGTAASPGEGGYAAFASNWPIPDDYDWTTRRWFKEAVDRGSLVITKPYTDLQTGKTIISISSPVTSGGVLRGVIASDISTATVRSILYRNYTAKGSDIVLVDAEGNVIESDDADAAPATSGSLFASERFVNDRKRILSGAFFIRTDPAADRYYASIGLPDLGWVMVTEGSLSSFEDVRGTVLRFASILLFLAGLFFFLLARTWRVNGRLFLARQRVEEANRNLELAVEERTASLRNILDNAEEGFFTFGETLAIDPSYSRGCREIFGKDIAGLSAPDLLFPGMDQIVSDFRQGFGLYFSGKSKAQIIFDLTERETSLRGRIIRVTYKETAGRRILCILDDATLEIEVKEREREEAESQARILSAIHNKHFFAQYGDSADNLFAHLGLYEFQQPSLEEKKELMRLLHSFKGDSGFFGFITTQASAHESETLIADSLSLGTEVSYREIVTQLRRAYARELKTITDTMGERWIDESGGIVMLRSEFQKLVAYLRKKLPGDSRLQAFLDSFRKMSLDELFSRLPFVAAAAAERLGKKLKPMVITGGNPRVVPDRLMPLAEACAHIVNNMVDHGIEFPYERDAVQKPPVGTVQLDITFDKSSLTLRFSDDGRGINPREIEKVGRERGLIHEGTSPSNSELFALLFEDGFSTRKEATMTSGRGVGLAALREEARKLGGSVEISSKLGKGSVFTIKVPLGHRG